jgi:dipeptidyl aminopeptidase/acylaminoacyl peptidase
VFTQLIPGFIFNLNLMNYLLLLIFLSFEATTETVRFTNNGDTLEGNLDLPRGDGKVPLVVFVHGSGMSTRGDYRELSQKLNEAGFATFRYDKRGVGKSGGNFVEVSTWNSNDRMKLLAADAVAAIKALRSHKRVNAEKIIVMGGSQAGWIIPLVAGLADVSSTVCISGPTVSVGEEIYYSDLAEQGSHAQDEADKMLNDFKGQKGFDNIGYVSKMKKPSLWIFGGKDISIPVKRCIARLDSVKRAARVPVDMKIYPEGDHGIYNQLARRMEDYTSAIIQWLRSH